MTIEERRAQIDLILNSPQLRRCPELCKLLNFLNEWRSPNGAPPHEKDVAHGFYGTAMDPLNDIYHPDRQRARGDVGRLREKLDEFYSEKRPEDRLRVEIAKGQYGMRFVEIPLQPVPTTPIEIEPNEPGDDQAKGAKTRVEEQLKAAQAAAQAEAQSARKRVLALEGQLEQAGDAKQQLEAKLAQLARSHRVSKAVSVAAATLLVGVTLGCFFFAYYKTPAAQVKSVVPNDLDLFWNGIFNPSVDPVVVIGNAAFLGRPETGMILARQEKNGDVGYPEKVPAGLKLSKQTFNDYTGVGEAISAAKLGSEIYSLRPGAKFMPAGPSPRKKLEQVLPGKDVIFMGSPAANDLLRAITWRNDLTFEDDAKGVNGKVCILSKNEDKTEEYCADDPTEGSWTDYAMVVLTRGSDGKGIRGARSIVLLAGDTTFGTEAASELVSDKGQIAALKALLGGLDKPPPDFALLLEVEVTGTAVSHINIIDHFFYEK
jgi:hypothetical protein